jgi:signal transduction histidine kinase
VRLFASDRLTSAFAVGACASVGLLSWFGYRAVAESRNKSLVLAERQSSEAADLVLAALTRDMSGVQTLVLTSPLWNQFVTEHPHEVNDLVASAFARYAYPDTFFAWRAGSPVDRAAFFHRVERRPAWLRGEASNMAFPVVIDYQSDAANALLRRIESDASRGRNVSVFELPLDGVPYQVVTQLVYDDVYRQRLSRIVGFTVDLSWARGHYFSELTKQVWSIGRGPETGLVMHIRDGDGRIVAGTGFDSRGALTHQRTFDLLFLDADSAFPISRGYVPQTWSVAVSSAGSRSLFQASTDANRVLAFAGLSGLIFAIGLILTWRAGRASARLAAMRSDFVSAVTHELKTPIATITAAAETLAKDRLTGMSVHTCGRIVMMEAGRLARLVENLLAYSRIADIADTYSFGPIDVAAIFNDVQEDFEARLDRHGFELDLTVAPATRPVRGDRFALRLLFGNLVDNAIKYSDARRAVSLRAASSAGRVTVEVVDSGTGIPEDELPHVVKKFARGRRAAGGGSGLGLAIATRIAEDHGGNLQIRSAVGTGTTVTVTLPAA